MNSELLDILSVRDNFCTELHKRHFINDWDKKSLELDQQNEETFLSLGCDEDIVSEYQFRSVTSLLVLLKSISPKLDELTKREEKKLIKKVSEKMIKKVSKLVG